MENGKTTGRHIVASTHHVSFITRPHTSPKDASFASNDDISVMEKCSEEFAVMSKNHGNSKKRERTFRRIPSNIGIRTTTADPSTASTPIIRIWECPDGGQNSSDEDDFRATTRNVESTRSSSVGIQKGSSIVGDVFSISTINDRSVSSHVQPKVVRRQSSKPGHPEWKKLHHVQHGMRREFAELPGDKFVRILKGLRIIVGFCLAIKRCAQQHTESNVSSMLNELEEHISDNTPFSIINLDLDQLKESGVSKPVKHLGHRLRSILYIPPEKRSMEDVRKIFVFLRMLPTFRNWTVVILLNFCRYAVYQKYQPKQVIIKRGHYPEGYYIILSGKVLVSECVAGVGGDTSRSTYELTCGDIFGDKELVDNLPRQSTVICRTECELLTASREDYLEVVSRPMRKIMDENVEFLSKDTVVVPASDLMMNLIIIKTGKCKVVGEITEEHKTDQNRRLDRELRAAFPKEYDKRHKPELQRAHTSLELEWQTGEMRGVMKANLLMGIRDPERLVVSAGQKKIKERIADSWAPSGYGLNRLYEKMEMTKPRLQRSQTDLNDDLKSDLAQGSDLRDMDTDRLESGRRMTSTGKRRKTKRSHRRQDVVTPLEIRGHQYSRKESEERKPHFVVIDRLGPGSVFGLETIFFQCPLRLSLVSEGAECISISKTFFVRESNLEVLKAATDVVIRYPSMAYLRKQVDEKRKWERYKKQVVHQVIQPRLLSREPSRMCLT
ncbi:hypothetical protein LSH36_44g09002 [Paralvinella palmiformis]|uniref:Cyclic nucleotide-binding domain-containing protein n=1 Tax=Paralvinella palmiformis TaxID=53620 RepID=A0AAD9K6K9_9ANNE|nr:hypothetical protein LSH36_44g09002 [Paralvinella palmiformis]